MCKTSMGDKQVRLRKRSQFYLSPYVNEPGIFGKWRKTEKPRYWWNRSVNDEKFNALATWLNDKDGSRYVQRGTLDMYRSFFHPFLRLVDGLQVR